tara:strand:+ start:43 stop:450 length:408 start_codon:yes stop_codon:yes gene_type:complete
MPEVNGTNITDKIFNTAISYGYSPEAAAAIAATIVIENAGTELIVFRGERQKRYLEFCEKNRISSVDPDSKILYFFDELSKNRDYKASEIKYAQTVDDAIKSFNENYLGKTLNANEFLSISGIGNEIYTIFVSNL